MAAAAIERHLSEALRARQAGDGGTARRHFEAVLAIDPDQPMARNALGMEALAAGDARLAAEHFERACRGDPRAPALWINLAKARRLLEDSEGERQALEQALAVDQTHLMALIRLAQLHERLGEDAQATERWSGVLALANQIESPPLELVEIIAHARSFVHDRMRRLADALEAALAGELAKATPRDRRRVRRAADKMLGRSSIYVNECFGMHYPFLPADEFFDREHFPWLEELERATGEIRAEVEAILAAPDPGLRPYVEMAPGTPESKWTPLDRSLDWGSLHLWREGVRIDEACARAPRTAEIVEQLPLAHVPGRAPTVFFSILKAGKHIPPHTGVTNTRAIVHLPLIVPEGCKFRVGGETRPWVEGEAFAFDDTIEHEAWNPTERDRAVLILDTWNPHLSEHERAMICQLYRTADEQRTL
jgi:aspartate beta-hydroxylase